MSRGKIYLMVCKICKKGKILAKFLGVCKDCILERWEEAKNFVEIAHQKSRKEFYLLEKVPKTKNGIKCNLCSNECQIGEGEFGFCGLRKNENGKLISFVSREKAILEYYYDPIPTNCVAAPWCKAKEGYFNLAVFMGACNFNCLFCQNWHFKFLTRNLSPMVSIEELLKAINEKVHCVCFFGGDPGPQLPFIIEFSKRARKIKKDLRICLETNGIENKKMLEEIAKISFESNGIIKFDLKFFDEKLSIAISGVSNKRAFENFENLAKIDSKKLVASTLLIPGYVDEEQVFKIAKFISSIDPQIPYNLLAFYPCFKFSDLPTTSFDQAQACFESAKKAGLKNVRIGNVHLLS
jgi:pyruvate formate lyase activating enzyme